MSQATSEHNPTSLHLHGNLEAADDTSLIIIKGCTINTEMLQKLMAERRVELFVVVTVVTVARYGDAVNIAPDFRRSLLAEDEDATELYARHLFDVFNTGTGQYIEGAGITSSKIRFFLELPATREGIDSDWVFLEEVGRNE